MLSSKGNNLCFVAVFCLINKNSLLKHPIRSNTNMYSPFPKDGTGDYTYIQDAIDAMQGFPLAPITLYI
jgi:pectinesterase